MIKRKLYFAHPINTYGTPLERLCLALIRERIPGYTIVNPSDQIHVDKVAELRKNDPKANVMPYFIELVDSCDDVAVLPFGDGMWGTGVWAEAKKIEENGGLVWIIDPIKLFVTFVPKVLEEFKLSVDETRARIRNPDGTTKSYA